MLAITHDFLGQHGSTLSFNPSGYEVSKVQSPSQERPPLGPEQLKLDGEDAGDRFLASYEGWHTEQLFTLKVWRRTLHRRQREVELRPGKGGPPLYDFSLDARRNWKSKAAVSEDLSYSLADMLYGLLVERPEGQSPDGLFAASARSTVSEESASSSSRVSVVSGPVLLTSDMAQAPTLFMALTLFQQRLKVQEMPLNVVCSVYRNTIAPRLDGRNGFVFKVWIKRPT